MKAGDDNMDRTDISEFLKKLFNEDKRVHPGYKEVKNLVHNEMGIGRVEMIEIFTHIAKEEVAKIMGEERQFIRGEIRNILKEVIKGEMMAVVSHENFPKVIGNTWHYYNDKGQDFRNFILDIMKKEIIDELRDTFDMNLEFNSKKKEVPQVTEDGWVTVEVTTSNGNKYVLDDESLLNVEHLKQAVERGHIPESKIHIRCKKSHHIIKKEELDELLEIGWREWKIQKAKWVEEQRAKIDKSRRPQGTIISEFGMEKPKEPEIRRRPY